MNESLTQKKRKITPVSGPMGQKSIKQISTFALKYVACRYLEFLAANFDIKLP